MPETRIRSEREMQNQDDPQLDDPTQMGGDQPSTEELEETNQDPQDGPIDSPQVQPGPSPEYVRLLEEQVREQNRIIQETINRQSQPTAPEPTPDPEELKQRFYSDPYNTMREAINQELATAIAPLREFVAQLKGNTEYDKLKSRFSVMPQFAAIFQNPDAVAALDQIMAQADKTDQNMQAALVQVAGLMSLGALPGSNGGHQPAPAPAPQFAQQQPRPTNQQGATVPNPPYMRPSGAPRPGAQAPTTTRKLTELEKRLAREAGMSEADYLKWLETPANKVIDSDIGKAGAK